MAYHAKALALLSLLLASMLLSQAHKVALDDDADEGAPPEDNVLKFRQGIFALQDLVEEPGHK